MIRSASWAGDFQNESGKDSCKTAELGWYVVDIANPSEVRRCPVGYECPQAGTTSPQKCKEGRFAGSEGTASCELCTAGTYQNRSGAFNCFQKLFRNP